MYIYLYMYIPVSCFIVFDKHQSTEKKQHQTVISIFFSFRHTFKGWTFIYKCLYRSVYIYIYIYMCTCVCTLYICMYIYIYMWKMWVYIYIFIKINLYIIYCLVHVLSHHQPSDLTSGAETAPAKRKCVENIFICIHITYIRVCIYIYVRTLSGYTYIYTHIRSNKYVYIYIHIYIWIVINK